MPVQLLNMRFNDLRFASGLSSKADKSKVTLMICSNGREFIEVAIDELQDVELKDGDIHPSTFQHSQKCYKNYRWNYFWTLCLWGRYQFRWFNKLNSHLDTTYTFTIIGKNTRLIFKQIIK